MQKKLQKKLIFFFFKSVRTNYLTSQINYLTLLFSKESEEQHSFDIKHHILKKPNDKHNHT